MKVLYELDLNDIIRIVAEKYGVPQEKVKKTNKDGLNYLMIDMSETETPEQEPEKKEPEPIPEEKEPEPAEVIVLKEGPKEQEEEVSEEESYKLITDELLQAYIAAERTIPQICKAYKLTDSKYSARLYKRAEKFRSEGARLGRKRNKEKAEDTEPTAG